MSIGGIESVRQNILLFKNSLKMYPEFGVVKKFIRLTKSTQENWHKLDKQKDFLPFWSQSLKPDQTRL